MSSAQKRLRFYYVFLGVYLVFQLIILNILKESNRNTYTNAIKILEIYKELCVMINRHSDVDNSGLFKIVEMKKLKSTEWHDVTLVSQCSSNHFLDVERLFSVWEGPISMAIYSDFEHVEKALWDMAKFMHCHSMRDFGMQLVIPTQDVYIKDYKFAYTMLSNNEKSVPCNSPYVSVLVEKMNYDWSVPYPVNLLRNVARAGTSTEYILVIDVDIVPSTNLREGFLNLTRTTRSDGEKVVYVVPIFETLNHVDIPRDKKILKKMVETNLARPFYSDPCDECQKLTNYNEWLKMSSPSGVRVVYQVEWKHPWEPFFIAPRNVPNFDERFRQYGMNRVSQICEVHVAGFKFRVLDDVFLIHKGFKTVDDFHRTKEKEMEENRRVYARFKIELMYKYPKSGRSC